MRFLVTGATGFVGRHAVRHLVAAGHELGILVPPAEASAARHVFDEPAVRHFHGTMDAVPWRQLAGFGAEGCIHLAWVATPGSYLESPENVQHLLWSQAFIQRLADCGVRRLLVAGSCAEYTASAGTGGPMPLYAQCKARLWQWLQDTFGNGGHTVAVAWARLFYPYGPGEAPGRLVSALIGAFREGRSFTLRCPTAAKDYIHIRDVATALATLALAGYAGAADVGTGRAVPLGALAGEVAALMGCPQLLVLGAEEDRLGTMQADTATVRGLGWRQSIALADGLREMVDGQGQEGRP